MAKLNAVNAIFGSKISDYHGQYGMNHLCQKRARERKSERITVFKDLNEKWKRHTNSKIYSQLPNENEINDFSYLLVDSIMFDSFFPAARCYLFLFFFALNVPLKFGVAVADVKDACSPIL